MKAGTHFSSNATGGFVIDRMDTTLSKLNEEGLRWLLTQPMARDLRRKVERRMRRMGLATSNANVTGLAPAKEVNHE